MTRLKSIGIIYNNNINHQHSPSLLTKWQYCYFVITLSKSSDKRCANCQPCCRLVILICCCFNSLWAANELYRDYPATLDWNGPFQIESLGAWLACKGKGAIYIAFFLYTAIYFSCHFFIRKHHTHEILKTLRTSFMKHIDGVNKDYRVQLIWKRALDEHKFRKAMKVLIVRKHVAKNNRYLNNLIYIVKHLYHGSYSTFHVQI